MDVAIYLVGQGSYKEPRLIEMQYFRILKYCSLLEEKLNTKLNISKIYVDINYPRENYDNLYYLIEDIRKSKINTVLIDLTLDNFHGYKNIAIINTLEKVGAKVYNSYYDDERAMLTYLINKFGSKVCYTDLPSDSESLVALFPGLISGILFEVLGDYIYNDYKDVNDLQNSIYKEIEKLTDSNPYNGSSSVPWITLKKYLKLLKKQDENYNERRLVEETYIISPNNNKMLWDELLDSRAKDKKDWVYNRLINLGFTHSFEDNSHLFTMNYESNYIIYADPRLESSIEMRIYKINHSINTMEYDYINSFKFLDYWVKDLNKKLISKINNLII